jgi:hypothetical protein
MASAPKITPPINRAARGAVNNISPQIRPHRSVEMPGSSKRQVKVGTFVGRKDARPFRIRIATIRRLWIMPQYSSVRRHPETTGSADFRIDLDQCRAPGFKVTSIVIDCV